MTVVVGDILSFVCMILLQRLFCFKFMVRYSFSVPGVSVHHA